MLDLDTSIVGRLWKGVCELLWVLRREQAAGGRYRYINRDLASEQAGLARKILRCSHTLVPVCDV